jgi:hypothetical protein
MALERVPLRLDNETKRLVDQARGDIGLNTYLTRAVENQLIADGLMEERDEADAPRTNRVRPRPRAAGSRR